MSSFIILGVFTCLQFLCCIYWCINRQREMERSRLRTDGAKVIPLSINSKYGFESGRFKLAIDFLSSQDIIVLFLKIGSGCNKMLLKTLRKIIYIFT